MKRAPLNYTDIAKIFLRTGMMSFGGWSTTALLLEQELVKKHKAMEASDIKGAVAYAQILPGATQVSIVSNV